jgi:hypothetical protein
MKNTLSYLLFVLAASVAALVPQKTVAQDFEGHVKMRMQSGKSDPTVISFAMKGQRMRMEIPTGKETMVGLVDWEKREMSMLMPGQTMYMVTEMKDVPIVEEVQKSQASTQLEKTSETATIVGREATKYISREGKTVMHLWLAPGIGSFYNMSGGNPMKAKKLSDWEREIIAKKLFPLRMVGFDSKGKQSMTTEVVELTPQKLDDAMFVPPPGYTRFSMGGLLKGLGGGK